MRVVLIGEAGITIYYSNSSTRALEHLKGQQRRRVQASRLAKCLDTRVSVSVLAGLPRAGRVIEPCKLTKNVF